MEPEGFAPFSSKRRMTFHVILGCAWKKTGSTLVFSTGPDVEIWSSNSTFGGLHFFSLEVCFLFFVSPELFLDLSI